MISRAKLKNTVIIAIVISFCLVMLIYLNGFSLISGSSNNSIVNSENNEQNYTADGNNWNCNYLVQLTN